MVAPADAADELLPLPEDRETPEELRVVAARIALEELRTPPTEAPLLPPEPMLAEELPEEEEDEEEPPPPALDVTEPARELGVLPPLLLLDPPLEEPLEEDPPPPLLDPPPPLPRLRPIKAPPPPP
ncbi:MAG: hypothetical protein JST93_07255, partial [Acidobacteria bacterium]|nr:hypothetical protein [Acidobacteriota bacterium]